MHPTSLPGWRALLMAVAASSVGCAHVQRTEIRIHVVSNDSTGVGAELGSGGAGGHDCQKEHEECMEGCWNKRYPWPHTQEQSGWYYKRCTADCKNQYNDCVDEQEEAAREKAKKLEFPRMDQAIEWIRQHQAGVALGTVVVVGGAAFVLTTGGSGALILAPLAL